jgi:LmbE family N-acetylglucosaminyl deacetylase
MMQKRVAEGKRASPSNFTALAIAAHPDDIEFMMAGTLILLKDVGWDIHYMNIANGSCGTETEEVDRIVATRRQEAINACKVIRAQYHESITNDIEICHSIELLAKVIAVVRQVGPRILLLHSPTDYMEDHMNACRIGVSAAFARGMRNAPCDPPVGPIPDDVTVYHALPYGLRDPLRRVVRAGQYADVTSVIKTKRDMLAAHRSQKEWLDASQGLDAYLDTMETFARQVGRMSGVFECAEGWRRRLHLGFAATDQDPLSDALGDRCVVDAQYEASL